MDFSAETIVTTIVAIVAVYFIWQFISSPTTCPFAANTKLPSPHQKKSEMQKNEDIKEQKVIEKRYFTLDELREFNGENDKPIYLAIKGEVYDVSSKQDFYGPGEGYHLFAGRETARALAKMSFEKEELDNTDVSDLNFMEKEILSDWINKFEVYNAYPKVGRVIYHQDLTLSQLKQYARNPVYVALNGVIYDVTLHGMEHYGPSGAYKMFAGQDATRALACMSFDTIHLENPSKEGLTDAQLKTLQEWEAKFQKKYAVIGNLV